MSIVVNAEPHTIVAVSESLGRSDELFSYFATADDRGRVVHFSGELDASTRNAAFNACFSDGVLTAVVDLGGLRFMDSSGYDALVAVGWVAHDNRRTLTIENETGEPARFLALLRLDPEC